MFFFPGHYKERQRLPLTGFVACHSVVRTQNTEFCLCMTTPTYYLWTTVNWTRADWGAGRVSRVQYTLYGRSLLLTAGDSNCTASKCVLTHTHTGWLASFKTVRVIIGGKQPNSAPHALFSVFLWTLKFSSVFFSSLSDSLSAFYSKFVPYSLATMTEVPPFPFHIQ